MEALGIPHGGEVCKLGYWDLLVAMPDCFPCSIDAQQKRSWATFSWNGRIGQVAKRAAFRKWGKARVVNIGRKNPSIPACFSCLLDAFLDR